MSVTDRSLVAVHLPPQRAAAVIVETWRAGGAVLPLDPRLSPSAAEGLALAQGADRFVGESGSRDLAGPGGDAALGAVVFTSGSTGAPKPVELTHEALSAAATITNEALGAGSGDRWLCCLPLHHIAGLGMLRRAEALGAPAVLLDRFEVEAVAGSDAGFMSLVPTALVRLLDAGVDVTRYKAILLGGAAIPAPLVDRARQAGANVVRGYGMTETCGGVVYDGVPLPGVRVRADGGELPGDSEGEGTIEIASPTLMRGYRGSPPLRDEWFRTSDLGRISGGELEVLGRLDNMIVTGGEKVAPARVEAALLSLDGVTDALVVGADDPEWGQRVVAFVVAPSAGVLDLKGSLAGLLLRHEVPKDFVAVETIERTPTGKPDSEWLQRQMSR